MSELGIPFVSLVVPVWNEEKRLTRTLPEILDWAKAIKFGAEVLIVDDHSTDFTCEIVRKYAAKNRQLLWLIECPEGEKGKGAAVKAGLLEARGLYSIMLDVDLSTPLNEFHRMLDHCQKLCNNRPKDTPAMVIGSRAMPDSKLPVPQPWYRAAAGNLMRWLTRRVTGLKYRDTQCGFKCFSKCAVEMICPKLTEQGFVFDVEMLLIADRMHIPVEELGVLWVNDLESKIDLIPDSQRMLKALIRLSKLYSLKR